MCVRSDRDRIVNIYSPRLVSRESFAFFPRRFREQIIARVVFSADDANYHAALPGHDNAGFSFNFRFRALFTARTHTPVEISHFFETKLSKRPSRKPPEDGGVCVFFFTPSQLRNDNRKRCERGSPPCSAGADLRLLVWRSVDKVTVVGSLTEEASLSCSLIVVDSFRIYIHIRLFACASSVWVPRACWPFSDLFDCLIVDYGSRFSVISSCRRVHVFDLRCTLPRPCLIDYGVRFAYSACKEILR